MENCGRFVFYNNIYFITKNQKQNNRHCVTCYVISVVYTLINHSSRPISARGFARHCKIRNIHHALIITVSQPVSTLFLQGGGWGVVENDPGYSYPPRLIAMICPLDRELREANKTSSTYHYLRRFQQMLLLSPVQTEATCLANNSQHFWMLYVASVCTSRCILMRVVGICCAKFETGQTFSYVQTHATTYNIVGSTMLGVVASVYPWL